MTNAYRVVQWNTHKRVFDLILICWISLYLFTFVLLGIVLFPAPENISPPILLIRALGTCAIVMLHFILMIGPLARLMPKMNVVLYNRRHLGVAFFFVALSHGALVIAYYGGFGDENPFFAVLLGAYSVGGVPYELFGLIALTIFGVMAATSHDFWLVNLTPTFWKFMHMCVYVAYVLVLAHVIFGVLSTEKNLLYPLLLTLGALAIVALHLGAGLREMRRDHRSDAIGAVIDEGGRWVDVCSVDDIAPNRARVVQVGAGERVAVFRHNDTVSAVTNVCAHQGGPLGEGKIVNGCVTCPWHGYQYHADKGQSPPPYSEKIATYKVRVEGRRVLIDPRPNAPGTPERPAKFTPWPSEERGHD